MSNDVLRFVIDRREGKYYWQFTELGEEHKGNRGYSSLTTARGFKEQIYLLEDY